MEYINALILINFSIPTISGYIDPGSAMAILAMIVGAVAGAGMTLKLYWFKIREKISKGWLEINNNNFLIVKTWNWILVLLKIGMN